jgi:hypothetical protein
MPPSPAKPAETAKRVILIALAEMPDVDDAASDVRTALIIRPEADLWRLRMSNVTTMTMTASTTAIVLSSERWNGPIVGCGIAQPCWRGPASHPH